MMTCVNPANSPLVNPVCGGRAYLQSNMLLEIVLGEKTMECCTQKCDCSSTVSYILNDPPPSSPALGGAVFLLHVLKNPTL